MYVAGLRLKRHGNTLQHTVTHCNILLQHTATQTCYNVGLPSRRNVNTMQHTATHFSGIQIHIDRYVCFCVFI